MTAILNCNITTDHEAYSANAAKIHPHFRFSLDFDHRNESISYGCAALENGDGSVENPSVLWDIDSLCPISGGTESNSSVNMKI